MQNKKTLEMVQLAVLIAVMLILAFTPIGYLKVGALSISLMTVPVVIGATILGPGAGAVLGLVFGVTSFYQCLAGDAFGAMLLSINPFYTFLVTIPTRTLMGWLVGLIFKALWKVDRTKTVSFFVAGLLGAFLNTLFFMSMLMICFGHTEYLQSFNATGANLVMFAVAFCGINGLLEMPLCCVLGGAIGKALNVAFKKNAATPKAA